ncbi:uncharacterized protein LOC113766957 [Coffea eugenioides]|uniref:uncharacterized protein LOC113766957 n=1 Tax=Coffea eugenioides TaxID=49369 RepID=UPI000F60C430|nr:uncharacterized protein LOC113766957 [Coffea eugenioides]
MELSVDTVIKYNANDMEDIDSSLGDNTAKKRKLNKKSEFQKQRISAHAIQLENDKLAGQERMLGEEYLLQQFPNDKARILDYIFNEKYNQHTPIVRIGQAFASRSHLACLKPRTWLTESPINLVANMLRMDIEKEHQDQTYNTWYMPTFFTCELQKAELDLTATSKYLDADRYGGNIEMCEKIFVPINEDNQHWYCTQVDFVKKKVYILDSLSNSTKQRGVMVRKLVQVLDTVLQHKFGDKYKFQASSFEFDESPNIPKQSNSDDCGVYVINFMKVSEVERMSSIRFQSEAERFNIAMELVLHPKNACGFLPQDHL